jgi:hypothetical protein
MRSLTNGRAKMKLNAVIIEAAAPIQFATENATRATVGRRAYRAPNGVNACAADQPTPTWYRLGTL